MKADEEAAPARRSESAKGSEAQHRFSAGDIASMVLGSLAMSVIVCAVAVSLSVLVFSGPLSAGVGRASTAFILGTVIVTFALAWRTSMRTVIAGAQDTAAIVAAAVAASLAADSAVADDQVVPTVVVMLAIAGAITGIAMWLVGRTRLSSIVRFLPEPVVSGFVGGTGWLLFRGGIEVALPTELHQLSELFTSENVKYLLPALALGLFIVATGLSRFNNAWMSVAILGGVVAFHLIGRSVSSSEQLETDGWLIGPFLEGTRWTPVGPSDFADANWSALVGHAVPILALVGVSIVGVLLNLGGLEPILGEEVDMDHELKVTGPANVAIAGAGGMVSYVLLGDTSLGRLLGLRGRLPHIIIGCFGLGLAAIGPSLIGLVPRSVAGGVLIGLGLSVLVSWMTKSLPNMARVDRILSAVILATIALFGVLPGVGLGVLVATLIFVVNSSRLDPIQHIMDAAGQSNVDRPDAEKAVLAETPNCIVSAELRGYLFFGSVMRLRELVSQHFDSSEERRWLILDFSRVVGMDSTATTGIANIARQLSERNASLVLSNVDPDLAEVLNKAIDARIDTAIQTTQHRDLDHAIEWCEEQLIAGSGVAREETPLPLAIPPSLAKLMELRTVEADTVLITAGATNRDLYFVESGTLTAWGGSPTERENRLRQMRAGTVLGEVAFVTGQPRTATVVADTETHFRVLSHDQFLEHAKTHPAEAVEFQQSLLEALALRLQQTTAAIRGRQS